MVSRRAWKLSRYDKVNLVPFGEFVPWPLGILARKISTEAGDFKPGSNVVVSTENGHRIGTFICYESVFPGFIRKFVEQGAEVLFNLSNDSWFGHSAARHQHPGNRAHARGRRTGAGSCARPMMELRWRDPDPAGRVTREARSFQAAVSERVDFDYSGRDHLLYSLGRLVCDLCAAIAALSIWQSSIRAAGAAVIIQRLFDAAAERDFVA